MLVTLTSFFNVHSCETIFQVIKMAFLSICQDNLPIFGITKSRSLTDFATTEKDVSRGISRMPLVLARIYEEDISFSATAKTRPKFVTSPSALQREKLAESEKLMANLSEMTSHRNDAQRRSLNLTEFLANSNRQSLGKSLDAEVPKDEGGSGGGSLLYRRNTVTEVTWNDFELISIIGRGTFGKVYLVNNKLSDKYYAMKCIRKDVVI